MTQLKDSMSNIEKIRQEIERRIGSVNEEQDANPAMPKYRWNMYEGMKEAFIDMKYFIDSLPEEKPSEELKEAADEYADDNFVQWVEDDEIYSDADKIRETFIAGAEWALNQGVKATGMISPRGIIYDNNIGYRLFLERYHNGDKVEVQVRKIEENGK